MGRRMGKAECEFSTSRPMATQDMKLKEPSFSCWGNKPCHFSLKKARRMALPQAMTSHSLHADLKWLALLTEQTGGGHELLPMLRAVLHRIKGVGWDLKRSLSPLLLLSRDPTTGCTGGHPDGSRISP